MKQLNYGISYYFPESSLLVMFYALESIDLYFFNQIKKALCLNVILCAPYP